MQLKHIYKMLQIKKNEIKVLEIIGLVLVILVIGTALDFATHSLSEKFTVPEYYFKDKIIFGTLWGVVALWAFQKVKNPNTKAALFAGTVAVLLQIRYLLTGYALWFVVLFLFLHFLMFLIPALIIFKRFPEIFK